MSCRDLLRERWQGETYEKQDECALILVTKTRWEFTVAVQDGEQRDGPLNTETLTPPHTRSVVCQGPLSFRMSRASLLSSRASLLSFRPQEVVYLMARRYSVPSLPYHLCHSASLFIFLCLTRASLVGRCEVLLERLQLGIQQTPLSLQIRSACLAVRKLNMNDTQQTDGQMDRRTDEQADGRTDGQTDG